GDAITSAGGLDVFVAKLSSEGKNIWVSRHGAAGDQIARSVAVDALGNIALTGELSGALDFGAAKGANGTGAGGSTGAAGAGSGGASGAKAGAGAAGAAGAAGKGGAVSTELKSVGGTD